MTNPWILAARPKTLAAAVVPVLVGTALARNAGTATHWTIFLLALTGAVCIQIGTNLVNDAIDFKKGTDTAERLGPLRVSQAGLLPADSVLRGAYLCFFLAACCGIPLILRGGLPILIIGITSILAAYAYTGGPYPLAYHGLGELFVMIFFGFVSVGGSYFLQRLLIDRAALVAGFACGSMAITLLAINNLRDLPNDRASSKRTMAARFGEGFARAEIRMAAMAPFLALLFLAWMRDWHLLGALVALPIAILLLRRVARSEGASLNSCLAIAGMLEWTFGLAFVLSALL